MMSRTSRITGFVCRFAVIYVLLILPWPGWDELYGAYFRALGQMAFTRDEGKRVVLFVPYHEEHGFSTLNSRMILGNRDLIDEQGKGPSKMLNLDTRAIGWIPTALTLALILATPVPWLRRGLALLLGLVLVHGFILFSLLAWIWDKSPEISLTASSPLWSAVDDGLVYTLLAQMGASFSVPVLIWIIVTFRRQDLVGREGGRGSR